jgi:hypothetical protein
MGNLFAIEAARKPGADTANMAISAENRKGEAVPTHGWEFGLTGFWH